MLGSTDSLEATSSNATRATYNYEVDTPMTGSLTSGGEISQVTKKIFKKIFCYHLHTLATTVFGFFYSPALQLRSSDYDF